MRQIILILSLTLASTLGSYCTNITAPDGTQYNVSSFSSFGILGPFSSPLNPYYLYKFELCGTGFACGIACAGGNAGSCQTWGNFTSGSTEACYGTSEPQNVEGLNKGLGVTFNYLGGDRLFCGHRSTTVNLNCDPTKEEIVLDDSQLGDGYITIRVSSKYACPIN
eukprot:TRINITY_DN7283_c0_g1_i1.p1 TRINITY_DN7283_c0_g1~~TRINITY_DN7283_c0_g1_i1.p1  ORF type:complete len:178 (+),score=24.03 TRINITY_DN7283_c0_g1_i1:39-536(+)